MKHANLSIFVPHVGCPHQCSFCNQRSISGAQVLPDRKAVKELCLTAEKQLDGHCGNAEIAFFGGSFTAIDPAYMLELLHAAEPFVHGSVFRGIRISTRPDAIDREILSVLKTHHVTAIELGAQSMSDQVLEMNSRGHTAAQVKEASARILDSGFELGLQMMTGLYGSDEEKDWDTALQLAALKPDTVRIYPTLVVEGTALAEFWRAGSYCPQTLEETVALGARLLEFFEHDCAIPVIRMGLHAQESLRESVLAGPYHPAYRELCEGRLLYNRILKSMKKQGNYLVRISPRSVSKITGHGAGTIEKLRQLGYNVSIRQEPGLVGLDIMVEEV